MQTYRRFLADFAPLHTMLLHTALGWLACLSAVSAAENWDRFRGPNGAGQAEITAIPIPWTTENVLWKQSLPGVGHSSPVIWEDKLFLTSANQETGEQILQAFDSHSGKVLWERRIGASVPSRYPHHAFNNLASSTPAVDDRHVYVAWLAEGKVTISAIRHNGDDAWQTEVGAYQEQHGFGKSPIVVDGLVCLATDSEAESAIVALDATSGELRWRLRRASGITSFATPCLLDPTAEHKQLVAISTAAGLTAVDVATGNVVWHGFEDDLTYRCVGSPVVAGGLLIFGCGEGGGGKLLIAARPGDEQHGPQEVYRLQQGISYVPTPVVAGDLLFLWGDRGVVACHDVATGRMHWRQRVGGDYHSSPLRIGNCILGFSRDGEAVMLAADRKFKLLGRYSLGEPTSATPAVAHNRLYVRTIATLFCIGAP